MRYQQLLHCSAANYSSLYKQDNISPSLKTKLTGTLNVQKKNNSICTQQLVLHVKGHNSTEKNCYCSLAMILLFSSINCWIVYSLYFLLIGFLFICRKFGSFQWWGNNSRYTQEGKTPEGLRIHNCLDKLKIGKYKQIIHRFSFKYP